VTVACNPHDELTLTVTELLADGSKLPYAPVKLVCLYVRREIRDLTEDDLAATLDAMHALWAEDDTTGRQKYGGAFRSASYLTALHQVNAGGQDGDHVDEGNGFLAQHIKFSAMFDESLRSVNPAATLPYWDYTIDAASGRPIYESPVMSAAVFGSMTQPKHVNWGFTYANDKIERAAIPDGRWAQLRAEPSPVAASSPDGADSFVRAPWNLNPSPYVSRFTSKLSQTALPGCAAHLEVLQTTSLGDFLRDVEAKGYGGVPQVLGGVYGCDQLIPMQGKGYLTSEADTKAVCANWETYLKELYRLGLVDFAHDGERGGSISCGADGARGALRVALASRLAAHVPDDMDEAGWDAWLDFVCGGPGAGIFYGDPLGPAAPADPSFWAVHPTLERLLQAKYMAGGFADEEWPADAAAGGVCAAAQCLDASAAAPDASSYGYHEACCYGHRGTDQLLDLDSSRQQQQRTYFGPTNAEILAATDPRSPAYSMPYVYDGFSWAHCGDADFKGALTKLFSAAQAPSASLFTPLAGLNVDSSPSPLRSVDAATASDATAAAGKKKSLNLFELMASPLTAATAGTNLFEFIGRTTSAPLADGEDTSSKTATTTMYSTAPEPEPAAPSDAADAPPEVSASLTSSIALARGTVLGFPTMRPSSEPTFAPSRVPTGKPSTAYPTRVNAAASIAQIMKGEVTETVAEEVLNPSSSSSSTGGGQGPGGNGLSKAESAEAEREASKAAQAALTVILNAINGAPAGTATTAAGATTGDAVDATGAAKAQFVAASTDAPTAEEPATATAAAEDGAAASAGAATPALMGSAAAPAATATATGASSEDVVVPDIGANVDNSAGSGGGSGGGGKGKGGGGKSTSTKLSGALSVGSGGEADPKSATKTTTTTTTQTFYFTQYGVANSAEEAAAADEAVAAAQAAAAEAAKEKAAAAAEAKAAEDAKAAALARLGGDWAILPLKASDTGEANSLADASAPSAEERLEELSWLMNGRRRARGRHLSAQR
jgi:hypothetical protein